MCWFGLTWFFKKCTKYCFGSGWVTWFYLNLTQPTVLVWANLFQCRWVGITLIVSVSGWVLILTCPVGLWQNHGDNVAEWEIFLTEIFFYLGKIYFWEEEKIQQHQKDFLYVSILQNDIGKTWWVFCFSADFLLPHTEILLYLLCPPSAPQALKFKMFKIV